MRFNFEKHPPSGSGKKYGYASIMPYGPSHFAKRDRLITIKAINQRNLKFGDKQTLSKLDREQVQLLYKCKGKFSNMSALVLNSL